MIVHVCIHCRYAITDIEWQAYHFLPDCSRCGGRSFKQEEWPE